MAATLFDSTIYRDLILDREFGALFTDSAEVRAMMIVEGALAKAQGTAGVIPEIAAKAIHRASLELQIDPAGLSPETGKNAVVVPALVSSFRTLMQAPEYAQYVHFGATSQDIMDTGLALRLRQMLTLTETRLKRVVSGLAALSEEYAETPMAGRTYGQVATPTSFGAMAANWGNPLADLMEQLPTIRAQVLRVSLSGAAGTLSAMGDKGAEVRAELAKGLGLSDPEHSWHAERNGIAALAAWMTQVITQLAKMGDDLTLMTQSGIGEVRLPAAGGSSTMPQKQNPIMPSVLSALARVAVGLNATLQYAPVHRQQRDGAAWIAEWMTLPQLCLATGRALQIGGDLAEGMKPDADSMLGNIDDGSGLIYAEALSFELANSMPRPDAQAAVKDMCKRVIAGEGTLKELAKAEWTDLNADAIFAPSSQLGLAPKDARAFAARAKALV